MLQNPLYLSSSSFDLERDCKRHRDLTTESLESLTAFRRFDTEVLNQVYFCSYRGFCIADDQNNHFLDCGYILTCDNAGKKWREKNVEGENDLRTVECLRGRLLVERRASRVAKEEAELMQNKLIELERQLKAEIKSKKRAEKKLKFLTKKLKS